MKEKVFLLILIPIILYGTTNIDSLKIELNNLDNDDMYQTLNEIVQYYYQKNSDSSLYYGKEKLDLAKGSRDSQRIATSYLDLANAYLIINKNDLVFKNLKKANNVYSLLNDSLGLAQTYLFSSYHYFNINRFDKSLKFANHAKSLFSSLNRQNKIGETYTLISAIELALANYGKSLESIFNSVFYLKESSNKKYFVNVYLTLSDIYTELNNYKKAKYYILEAYKICDENSYLYDQSRSSFRLGYIYLKLGVIDSAKIYLAGAVNYFETSKLKSEVLKVNTLNSKLLMSEGNFEKALDLLLNSLRSSEELDLPWLISETSQQLGELYLIQKEYPEALKYISRGLRLAKNMNAKDLVLNNYKSLSKYYEQTGNYQQAFEIYKKYSELRDSLFIKNQNDITDLQIDYFTERIKEENELLQKDLAISQLESEKQKLLTTFFLSGLLAILIVSLAIFYLYRRKKNYNIILQHKIKSALEAQREQQQIIVHQAGLNSLGEFSAGIAHQMSQPLQNIILSIQQLEFQLQDNHHQDQKYDQNFKEIYEDMQRVQYTIDHIRLFSSRQQEDYSELFSINESLNNAYRMVKKHYDQLNIIIDLKLSPELPDLSGNPFKLEQVILNLLSNAKDAVEDRQNKSINGYLKMIQLQTYISKNQIVFEISDNGSGIPIEEQSKIFLPFFTTKKLGKGQGLGLSIANNIIQDFGGYIEVFSEFEQGTRIKVCLPVIGKPSHHLDQKDNIKLK